MGIFPLDLFLPFIAVERINEVRGTALTLAFYMKTDVSHSLDKI